MSLSFCKASLPHPEDPLPARAAVYGFGPSVLATGCATSPAHEWHSRRVGFLVSEEQVAACRKPGSSQEGWS